MSTKLVERVAESISPRQNKELITIYNIYSDNWITDEAQLPLAISEINCDVLGRFLRSDQNWQFEAATSSPDDGLYQQPRVGVILGYHSKSSEILPIYKKGLFTRRSYLDIREVISDDVKNAGQPLFSDDQNESDRSRSFPSLGIGSFVTADKVEETDQPYYVEGIYIRPFTFHYQIGRRVSGYSEDVSRLYVQLLFGYTSDKIDSNLLQEENTWVSAVSNLDRQLSNLKVQQAQLTLGLTSTHLRLRQMRGLQYQELEKLRTNTTRRIEVLNQMPKSLEIN